MGEVESIPVPERSVRDDWPIPVGWRILINPIDPKSITEQGIILPEEVVRAETFGNYLGRVVAMGELCYKHEKFGGGDPWCKIGDWVAYGQHAGQAIIVRDSRVAEDLKSVDAMISGLEREIEGMKGQLRVMAGVNGKESDEVRESAAKLAEDISAARIKREGLKVSQERRLRVVNDDEIMAVIPNTEAIRIYI